MMLQAPCSEIDEETSFAFASFEIIENLSCLHVSELAESFQFDDYKS